MTPQILKSRRATFWFLFLFVASICFALAISGRVRRQNAGRSAEILRPLLATDSRFTNIQVSCGTNGRVYLSGLVTSADDLTALRRLVEQTHLPSQPVFSVRVEGPNKATPGLRLCLHPDIIGPACLSRNVRLLFDPT
jgi:hypothetical protein